MQKIRYIIILMALLFAMSCNKDASTASSPDLSNTGTGKGGSTSRFAIVGNILYTVDNSKLNVFDITDTKNINKMGVATIGNGTIETIFARDNYTLFIGSQTGMSIYDVSNPLLISQLASVYHFRSCDPVVANENYAFVTLNSEGTSFSRRCWGSTNVLMTYDVKDLSNVKLLNTYNLTKPKGLALLKNNLFVCDDMLRWYDATDPSNLINKKNYLITSHDIIPLDSSLILVGSDGITQLAYQNDSIWFLSKIQTTP